MEQKLHELITSASNILVTSHISPDSDAVCSALLLGETLNINYPDKKTSVVLEEKPNRDLSFLSGYANIKFQSVIDSLKRNRPELLIIVDANKYDRISRNHSEDVFKYLQANDVKTAVIDHHEPHDKIQTDVYINNGNPAAVQDVYETLFDTLKLKKPQGYVDITLLGLISDTLRFKYKNLRHRQTFAIVSDLIDAGGSIEAMESQLDAYTPDQMQVLAHLASNLSFGDDYSYTYVADDFARSWQEAGKTTEDFKGGCEIFVNQYVRDITPNKWGFLVYRDQASGPDLYAASFRSQGGIKDVSLIAKQLGGGGHKPAAGAKFRAQSVDQAVAKVKEAISKML